MADKKKRPPDEDEAQSRRFIEAARALEATGGLDPLEGEQEVDRLLKTGVPLPKEGKEK